MTSQSSLNTSLYRQRKLLDSSLILTPVDSMPIYWQLRDTPSFLEGLYATDHPRKEEEIKSSKIFFGGRKYISKDIEKIYSTWAKALGAKAASMRLLSGLHAHVVVFMGIGGAGQKVMLLPEIGGGHFATKAILERLGYEVVEMICDIKKRQIDIAATRLLAQSERVDYLFVDRSEGLVYEDFANLVEGLNIYSIFDASQYLPAILSGRYRSPFDMGFDLVLSTLHKSFPGPQKALVATHKINKHWKRVIGAMSAYVSSSHIRGTYLAGYALSDADALHDFANKTIDNAVGLEERLAKRGVPVIHRPLEDPPTHHIWVSFSSREEAFDVYKKLEQCRVHVNYRLLPYEIGYGLRLGTTAATMSGMREEHLDEVADIITKVITEGFSLLSRHAVKKLVESFSSRSFFE